MIRASVAMLAGFAWACGDSTPLTEGETGTRFSPEAIAFDVTAVGELANARVELVHRGPTSARIQSITFAPSTSVFQLRPAGGGGSLIGVRLQPDEPVPVDVLYGPVSVGSDDGELRVQTDTSMAVLQVQAAAGQVALSDLTVSPSDVDFSQVIVGERVTRELVVENAGDLPVRLLGFRSPVDSLRLVNLANAPLLDSGLLIEPADTVPLRLVYEPSEPESPQGRAEFEFGPGVVPLPIEGRAVAPGRIECPEAVDFGSVLRGAEAVRMLNCSVVEGPVRVSAASVDEPFAVSGLTAVSELQADLRFVALGFAGLRREALLLQTTHGSELSVDLTAEILPPEPGDGALTVELTWDANRLDLDLHVVRSGSDPFVQGDDCYWAAKNPSWGDEDDALDDPFLDRDATDGFGPEEFSLTRANEVRYDVYVQYYDYEEVFFERPTSASLSVTPLGGPTDTRERELSRCGLLWHAATVRFNGGSSSLEWVDVVDERFRSQADAKCR